jgi:hypothetical protein
VVDADIVLQEYLIELQSDITAQARFKNDKQHFWISSEMANNFPQLWEKEKLFLSEQHYSRAADSFITTICTPDDGQLGRNM